jgi:hypothetical protein
VTGKPKGLTTEQRRSATYRALIESAPSRKARLNRACDYLRAAADGKPAEEVDQVIRDLVRVADQLNRKGEES